MATLSAHPSATRKSGGPSCPYHPHTPQLIALLLPRTETSAMSRMQLPGDGGEEGVYVDRGVHKTSPRQVKHAQDLKDPIKPNSLGSSFPTEFLGKLN